jgi:hypothetical protein
VCPDHAITECLDHAIVINEQHLDALLAEYVNYYNVDRPHRSPGLRTRCLEAQFATEGSSGDQC